MKIPTYALVTPARNEAQFIELTIQSVLKQTVRPLTWVIVDDGSTDGTDVIVRKNIQDHHWIELVKMPPRGQRNFSGKVHAFNVGYERLKNLDYAVIGNLDSDVSFDEDYFQFLLEKFAENPELGVAGTPFREGSFQYDYRFTSIEHVSGPCQLFKRACFEDIGGYVPREIGGIDLVAVLTARMRGWQTRTFPEKPYTHQRQMGTATGRALVVPFKVGQADYVLGSHPMWEFCRCLYQLTRRPLLLKGTLCFGGYLWAMGRRFEKQVPAELVEFRRKEQMQRLGKFLAGFLFMTFLAVNSRHGNHAMHFLPVLHVGIRHCLVVRFCLAALPKAA
jgi:poly-beta-1,6-N-acetyl-D-glucosamine synthase